jgi:hypothetical protein
MMEGIKIRDKSRYRKIMERKKIRGKLGIEK